MQKMRQECEAKIWGRLMVNDDNASAANVPIWEPVAWLIFSAAAYYLTLEFDGPLPTFVLGAAFWPRVVIAILAVAACILLASRYVQGRTREASETKSAYFDDSSGLGQLSPSTVAMFALPLIWVYGMHKLGFLLVTPFFLFAVTWLLGVRRLKTLIGFSLGFYAILVLVFYKLIFTPLPMGAGWFNALNGELLALIQ
jgi:hypothetical protein